jgi:hypothetical protein
MKLFITFLVCVGLCLGQGWTQLTNTQLQTVCPPNNFPIGGGVSYGFNGSCFGKITDYSGAVVDTKRNRLIIMGGGHMGYRGNEVYSLDLVTKSTTTATCGGFSCVTSTNSSVPTMTRLNDPTLWDVANCANEPDGQLQAEHSLSTIVYLPRHDKVFMWQGLAFCGSGTSNFPDMQVWLWDAAAQTWSNQGAKDITVGLNGASTASSSQTSGLFCALDPTTVDETVICIAANKDLIRYDVDTGVATRLVPYSQVTVQTGETLVVDPDRKILFSVGAQYDSPVEQVPHIYAIDLTSGAYGMTDWTSQVTGCGDWLTQAYPSAVWDPVLHRIVGYAPRTLASPNAQNEIFIFDPGTKTCVTQPLLGGAGPAAHSALRQTASGVEQGMYGRFNYVPALGEYVLVNNNTQDAYAFKLNANAVIGLGASSYTCVDRDGDKHGTGPQATGPFTDGVMGSSGLTIPSAPSGSIVGSAGTQTYYYWVEACDASGTCTALSPVSSAVTSAPLNPTSSNYINVTWADVGAADYVAIRTMNTTPPTGWGDYRVYNTTSCSAGTCSVHDANPGLGLTLINGSTRLSSVSYSFTSADINRFITTTPGNGFIGQALAQIVSVSGGVATLGPWLGAGLALTVQDYGMIGIAGSTGGAWQIEGCQGPDADDLDASVHSSAQFLAKWTNLKNGLAHLGYAPANFYYLATSGGTPAGNDANICHDTDGVTAVNSPCATYAHILSAGIACGDALIMRGGDYTQLISPKNCTAGLPFLIKVWPGELVSFTTASRGISMTETNYATVDGPFRNSYNNTGGSSIITMGSSNPDNLDQANHMIMRHIEGLGNCWGLDCNTCEETLVEDSVFHHQSQQHGIYWANHNNFLRTAILDINSPGSGYTTASNLTVTGGSGTNMKVSIHATAGAIDQGGLIVVGGLNYLANDILTVVQGGASGGTFKITAIGCGTNGNVNCTDTRLARNIFFRNLLLYRNPFTGIQNNGRIYNSIIENAISYNNGIAGFSWETGVQHSYLRDAIAFGNQGKGIDLSNYPGWSLTYDIGRDGSSSPYDQSFNTIDHFTCWQTGVDPLTEITIQQPCITTGNTSKNLLGDMGHLTVQNSILVGYQVGDAFGYAPLSYQNAVSDNLLYLASLTWKNNQVFHSGPGTQTKAVSNGSTYYTCAQLTTAVIANNGAATCNNADPQFISAANDYWRTPNSFNFKLQGSSPAYHTGSAMSQNAVLYDIFGSSLSLTPSLGAIDPAGTCNISHSGVGTGTVGQAVSYVFTANGCGGGTLTWTVSSGSLPAGSSGCASSTGSSCTVSGTLTTAATYTPNIHVTDGSGNTADDPLSITVNVAPVIITASLPGGTVGTAYSQSLSGTGGTTPYTWTVSAGALPTSLSLSSGGIISGTPSAAGTFNFTVKLTDVNSVFITKALSIVIATGRPTITSTSPLPDGQINVSYPPFQFTGTGSPAWTATGGPAGLSLSSAGVLSGVPTTAGVYTLAVTATNGSGTQVGAPTNFSLTISSPAPISALVNAGKLTATQVK